MFYALDFALELYNFVLSYFRKGGEVRNFLRHFFGGGEDWFVSLIKSERRNLGIERSDF